ncbi:MAG: hypothetical protein R2748_25785 [Bryobacterales bacterium]
MPRLIEARKRLSLRRASVVTAPSHFLIETMAPVCEHVELRNPLYLSRYEFEPRVAPRPRLVWLRRFHEIYNPVICAKWWLCWLGSIEKASLVMVGDERDSMRRTKDAAQRSAWAFWTASTFAEASRSRRASSRCKGDIFLNTTDFDNTPVSVLEAMAVSCLW